MLFSIISMASLAQAISLVLKSILLSSKEKNSIYLLELSYN